MGSRLEKNSKNLSKRIENHTFNHEGGEEYEGSRFGGYADYMRRKRLKLQNLDAEIRSQSTDKPQIFRRLVFHVNGYTQPSLSDLHTLIVSHGGGFLQYLDGKTLCTHIIASQLTPKKKTEFAQYRIVKPAWVVDSVNAGKQLPWENYRVVDEGVAQKTLGFENGKIISQTNTQCQSYRDQSDTSWYTPQMKGRMQDLDGLQSQTVALDGNSEVNIGPSPDDIPAAPSPLFTGAEEDLLDDLDDGDASLITPAIDPVVAAGPTILSRKRNAPPEFEGVQLPTKESLLFGTASVDVENHPKKRRITSEEHNAISRQDPHVAKSSTANPDFLNQYYRESRLHHLSTWKAELKAQLQARTAEKSPSQKSQQKRPAGIRRYIMHVDFDSFFAAVSLRKSPHLAHKPVVVAHGKGPGSEIASCNYPARGFGVKNGMWMKSALELCPDLQVLPYDFKAYEEASRQFYGCILDLDAVVQSISIDEALIDVSEQCIEAGGSDGKSTSEGSVLREQEKADRLAQSLRASVKDKTGCDVSVGIGGNILLAKVALRKAKPAGQHQIKPEEILDFIGELAVTDLPGVAHNLGNRLEVHGVKLVKDISSLTRERLITWLGPKIGERLWDYSRGIDRTEVGHQVVRKSVSAEINWGIRFVTQQEAEVFVQRLCDELHKRLLENGVKGRQLTMKIMRKAADAGLDPPKNLGHGKCDTFNKSVVLGVSTNDKDVLGKEAISVLRGYGFPPGELRGLGVQMQKLEPIKAATAANSSAIDSSQRRLQFQKPASTTTPRQESTRFQQSSLPPPAASTNPLEPIDSIEEVPTPKKAELLRMAHGSIGQANIDEERPLNIIGTQFVMPSQVDSAVLAELPSDIRSKFGPKQRSILDNITRSESPKPVVQSRSASPYPSEAEYALPNQSQLDPETLAELPDDVKEELMAHYRTGSKPATSRDNQQLLPQSPRKAKTTTKSRKVQLTPTKKHKFTSLLSKGKSKSKASILPTLTQSNFVSMAKVNNHQSQAETINDGEISKSFLEELPEDIRLEILADQKRNRMKLKSGLNVGSAKRKQKPGTGKDEPPRGQQKLQLPQRPSKPTFTSKKLSALPELRDAMSAWVQEYSEAGEEGPFEEDASALGQYLTRVVLEEGDMSKAISVVEWLAYLVGDWPFEQDNVRKAWQKTISLLQDMIQHAVAQRGLPPLVFEIT